MNELIVTIRKAAYVFGHGQSGIDNAIAVVRQIDHKGRMDYEDLTQLGEYIPGAVKLLAYKIGVYPNTLRKLMESEAGIGASYGLSTLNQAIVGRYPDIVDVVLLPEEDEMKVNIDGWLHGVGKWLAWKMGK